MTGSDVAFWAFIGVSFLFGYLAIREARHVNSVSAFFHDDRLSRNVLSYTAANITLGTGLVYIMSAIGNLGALFLVAPMMMLLGYFALARFMTTCADESLFSENLVQGLSRELDSVFGRPTHFAAVLSLILVVVFSLILSFEIFASSKILSALMFENPSVKHEVFVGSAVFLVALLYSLWGGFKAVQTTDRWQLCLIVLLLLGLGILFSLAPTSPTRSPNSAIIPPITPHVVFTAIAVGLAAFTTQFYSILNLCAASQQAREQRRRLFVRVGIWTFSILLLVITCALVVNSLKGNPAVILNEALAGHATGTSPSNLVFSAVLILGLSSVLFSTVDTIIVSVTQFSYSNLFGGCASNTAGDTSELRRVRIAMIGIGPFVFATLALVWFRQPDLFALLLGIVSGNDVLAPMLVLLVLLHRKGLLGNLRGPRGLPLFWAFIFLFVVAVVSAICFSVMHLPYTQYVGPLSFLASSAFAIAILKRNSAYDPCSD